MRCKGTPFCPSDQIFFSTFALEMIQMKKFKGFSGYILMVVGVVILGLCLLPHSGSVNGWLAAGVLTVACGLVCQVCIMKRDSEYWWYCLQPYICLIKDARLFKVKKAEWQILLLGFLLIIVFLFMHVEFEHQLSCVVWIFSVQTIVPASSCAFYYRLFRFRIAQEVLLYVAVYGAEIGLCEQGAVHVVHMFSQCLHVDAIISDIREYR